MDILRKAFGPTQEDIGDMLRDHYTFFGTKGLEAYAISLGLNQEQATKFVATIEYKLEGNKAKTSDISIDELRELAQLGVSQELLKSFTGSTAYNLSIPTQTHSNERFHTLFKSQTFFENSEAMTEAQVLAISAPSSLTLNEEEVQKLRSAMNSDEDFTHYPLLQTLIEKNRIPSQNLATFFQDSISPTGTKQMQIDSTDLPLALLLWKNADSTTKNSYSQIFYRNLLNHGPIADGETPLSFGPTDLSVLLDQLLDLATYQNSDEFNYDDSGSKASQHLNTANGQLINLFKDKLFTQSIAKKSGFTNTNPQVLAVEKELLQWVSACLTKITSFYPDESSRSYMRDNLLSIKDLLQNEHPL